MESIDFIGLGAIVFGLDFISFGAILIGGLMFIIGWIWLIVLGFKQGVTWGILMILFNWFTGLVFCFFKKTGVLALVIMTIGGIVSGMGVAPLISELIKGITGSK